MSSVQGPRHGQLPKGARTEQSSSKGREPKQLELVTLTHVGKAAPPPSPMRGPTKARQIYFELAKTKSKEQSYQEVMEREIKEELASKESEASKAPSNERREASDDQLCSAVIISRLTRYGIIFFS